VIYMDFRLLRAEEYQKALRSLLMSCIDKYLIEKDPLEKTYHVFIFGMMLTLGYECRSNMEAGYGRYDLFVRAPEWTAAIEFKVAKTEDGLEGAAREWLKQIGVQKYLAEAAKDKLYCRRRP